MSNVRSEKSDLFQYNRLYNLFRRPDQIEKPRNKVSRAEKYNDFCT